ncbi:MAG: DUF1854 domain-containing protein [Candidatus Solibacter usitatus]|nr:DUF1854 domain-containing protein [Candidatus Solibacter usitatus]
MFTLSRDSFDRLVLTTGDGVAHTGVEPVRAFPLSDPGHALSLCDAEGREVAFIDDLSQLPPDLRRTLEAELAQREFVPTITRIINTPPDTEPAHWHVETDRGITTFQLDSEDYVHRHDTWHFSIVDSRGIRYHIPDARRLDHHSRRVLDRFL